jgi:hypothetical protein
VHPTIDQIWYCKGVPRPNVFNRWRRELWEQVGPRLEALERENEALRAEVAGLRLQQHSTLVEGPINAGPNTFEMVPVKRGPGRPRKYPLPTEATA